MKPAPYTVAELRRRLQGHHDGYGRLTDQEERWLIEEVERLEAQRTLTEEGREYVNLWRAMSMPGPGLHLHRKVLRTFIAIIDRLTAARAGETAPTSTKGTR